MYMKERELIDIDVDEVSVVNKPANDETFLFFKLFGKNSSVCRTCGYTEANPNVKVCPACDGDLITKAFFAKETDSMDEILVLFKSLFGEELTDDEKKLIEKAAPLSNEAQQALKGALGMINKYKSDMPDELIAAIHVLAKYASGGKNPYPKPYKKEQDDPDQKDLSKSGKRHSKATISKLSQIVEIINSIIGSPDMKKDTDGETEKEKIEGNLDDVIKALLDFTKGSDMKTEDKEKDKTKDEKLEKKEEEKEDEEKDEKVEKKEKKKEDSLEERIMKSLEDISARLEVVEKAGGFKKSLPDKEEIDLKKTEGKIWTSFNLDD